MNPNEPTVALSLTVKSVSDALAFYAKAFDAKELYRMPTPDGGVAHAEFMIGGSKIYISDEAPDWHAEAMPEGTKASCLFAIQAENCDDAFKQAVEAGGKVLREPEDQFWGVREAMVQDPYGYRWSLCQMVEEVSPEEMARRAKELFGG